MGLLDCKAVARGVSVVNNPKQNILSCKILIFTRQRHSTNIEHFQLPDAFHGLQIHWKCVFGRGSGGAQPERRLLSGLVTLSTYRRYINKCIYLCINLSIYLSIYLTHWSQSERSSRLMVEAASWLRKERKERKGRKENARKINF